MKFIIVAFNNFLNFIGSSFHIQGFLKQISLSKYLFFNSKLIDEWIFNVIKYAIIHIYKNVYKSMHCQERKKKIMLF